MDLLPPPPEQSSADNPTRWFSLVLTAVFLALAGWGWVDRREQKDELRKHGEVLQRVEALNRAMDAKIMELTQRLTQQQNPERR